MNYKLLRLSRIILVCVVSAFSMHFIHVHAHENALVDVVKRIKPSVVGVGVYAPLGTVSHQLQGTGFVVGNGRYVVTNEHVINSELEEGIKSQRVVFIPNGRLSEFIPIKQIYTNAEHDLAIVEIEKSLPAVSLYKPDEIVPDGTDIALTGFPIGAVLGLFPATHKGIIAAYTPNVIPALHSTQITQQSIQRMQNPISIYQLDAVAYPGNSGSPLYLANSGEVIAVINKVFIKESKEAAISDPSGITYAIPIRYVYELAERHQIPLE